MWFLKNKKSFCEKCPLVGMVLKRGLIMVVDSHVHIVPKKIRENRHKYVTEKEKEVFPIYKDPKAKMVGAEELINTMDEEGVDKAVIFGFPWSSKELYQLNNDYVLEVAEKYRDRFIPFCCLDVESKEALKEIERCLKEGAMGVGELAFYSSDFDSRKRAILSEVADLVRERSLPILIHTNEEVGHNYSGKSPMTLRNLYLLIKENQNVKWILAHLGGGLPFFCSLKKEVKEVMRNCWFDTAAMPFLYHPFVYNIFFLIMDKEKLLFGTDYPLLPPKRYYKEFEKAKLDEKVKKAVLGENFIKLLGQK